MDWIGAGRMEVSERGKIPSENTGNGVSDSYAQDYGFLLDCVEGDQNVKEQQG